MMRSWAAVSSTASACFSSNNFYHQLNFAASAHEALVGIAAPDAVFVPIGWSFPASAPHKLWEFTLRSLSSASAAKLANQTHMLLRAPCTCFDRLVAVTHGMQPVSASSRAAFAAFRRSSAINARMVLRMEPVRDARRSAQDMLFIVRHGSRRVITNEEALRKQAQAAQPRLRIVTFEAMPIVQQLTMVSESSVLIGVHGMALAGYVVHLPTDERRTAILEIQPKPDPSSWEWMTIMRDLAAGAGVRHLVLFANHASGCFIDFMRHANCSSQDAWRRLALGSQASEARCRLALSKAWKSFAATSVLNCNVTVDFPKLLGLLNDAAQHTEPPEPTGHGQL